MEQGVCAPHIERNASVHISKTAHRPRTHRLRQSVLWACCQNGQLRIKMLLDRLDEKFLKVVLVNTLPYGTEFDGFG